MAKMTGGKITLMHVYPSGLSIDRSFKDQKYETLDNDGRDVLTDGQESLKLKEFRLIRY